MTIYHPETNDNEICVGNTSVQDHVEIKSYLSELETARVGDQAFDIHGKKIPIDQMRPLFVGKSEANKYDRIMMQRTFHK